MLLQWGRNLSVAEGLTAIASMIATPMLQWGRNLSVAEGEKLEYEFIPETQASMGPQPFGCGRKVPMPSMMARAMLQWGRNLSVAEGSLSGPGQPGEKGFNGAATFRLRKVRRRNPRAGAAAGFNGAATFRLRKENTAAPRVNGI